VRFDRGWGMGDGWSTEKRNRDCGQRVDPPDFTIGGKGGGGEDSLEYQPIGHYMCSLQRKSYTFVLLVHMFRIITTRLATVFALNIAQAASPYPHRPYTYTYFFFL
jgi:hypothetical protein